MGLVVGAQRALRAAVIEILVAAVAGTPLVRIVKQFRESVADA